MMQHPTRQFSGDYRGVLFINNSSSSSKSVAPLPTKYTSIPPEILQSKQLTAPAISGPVKLTNLQTLVQATNDEHDWLNTVITALKKQQSDKTDWISWAAYHASIQQAVIPPAAITGLLPLFPDNAHSMATIKLAMSIVQAAVQHLNPGNVPVLAADQPLYALAKQLHGKSPRYVYPWKILLLLYVRSVREGKFPSIHQVVDEGHPLDVCPRFYLLLQMATFAYLRFVGTSIFKKFSAGTFVVHTTSNRFFAIAIDQCHEQRNADAKRTGGAIRLMNDPAVLRRWLVVGSKVGRIVSEYEKCMIQSHAAEIRNQQHEQHQGVQAVFHKDVKSLTSVIEKLGRPFLNESEDLLALDTRNIMVH